MTSTNNVFDIVLITLLLSVLEIEAECLQDEAESLLLSHVREQCRLNRALPAHKGWVLWPNFVASIMSCHFRKMFGWKWKHLTVFVEMC